MVAGRVSRLLGSRLPAAARPPTFTSATAAAHALHQVWDMIIVGAGVAGSAFAYQQGCAGRRVLLLERELSQPDRIVGELLQVRAELGVLRQGACSVAGCCTHPCACCCSAAAGL